MSLWSTLTRLKRERDQANREYSREISEHIGEIVTFLVGLLVFTCAMLGYSYLIAWIRFG